MNSTRGGESWHGWRRRIQIVVFGIDTPAGRAFDIALLITILLSVIVVMLESVARIRADYGPTLRVIEWIFTGVFTVEYVLRLISSRRPLIYALSFFGIVDLLSIIPTYLSLVIEGSQSLIVIRILRLLRVFRILKLAHYLGEATTLMRALRASRAKITVFLFTIVMVVVVAGAAMYLVEGESNGFTSIPKGMYWAIVTMTTVGYGDISPKTVPGQTLASLLMILGYGIIAVPTGIVSVELAQAVRENSRRRICEACQREGHDPDASHCKYCGTTLGTEPVAASVEY
jgi:voltage-gated potassium channel